MTNDLDKQQVDLLVEAQKLRRNGKTPTVISEEQESKAKEALSAALSARGLDVDGLTLDALAANYQGGGSFDGDWNQNPQTAGSSDSEPRSKKVESLARQVSPKQSREISQDLAKIDTMAQRTPNYVETELKPQVANKLGCDPEDIPDRREWDKAAGLR